MAKILALRSNGELDEWMRKRRLCKPLSLEVEGKAQDKLRRPWKRKGEETLHYSLPALSGPHANRPWAQALRNLTSLRGIC
ncbi:MAG: hypothetical protein WCP58_11950 [bacterium]